MTFQRASLSVTSGLSWLICLMLLSLCQPLLASSLNGTAQGSLPAVEARLLLEVDGHTVAAGAQRLQVLDQDRKRWQPLALASGLAASEILATTVVEGRSWVLTGSSDDNASAVRTLQLQGSRLHAGEAIALPTALQSAVIGSLGSELVVAGNDAEGGARLLALDARGSWRPLSIWPGSARALAIQGSRGSLYLASTDGQWLRYRADAGWQVLPAAGGSVLPGSLRMLGQAHLMMLVSDELAGTRLRTFHTITEAWNTVQALPAGDIGAVGKWANGLLWQQDGQLDWVALEGSKHLLRGLDWAVIVVYLLAMLGMGLWFYLRDKNVSTADYFVGGRSIPFWAAGISLYATNTSSISFIAIPAKAFDSNWQYLTNNLMAVLGLVFVAIWIVPLLRRLDLMSVFSYLETRFHPAIRMLSSALCIVMQIGSRMSVILFLPALAISTITGVDVVWSILLMGVFTIIYSTIGGSKAVIWTDVVQVLVMFGGALFAIGFIFLNTGSELPQLMSAAIDQDKTRLFDFSFDLTKATVWGFIFLVVFDVVLTFPKDQVLMQRTLSTKSDKEAGRSIWMFAAIMIPGGFVFYGIGTALWMYYRDNPERLNPLLPIDATFPLFIAAELPAGVTGLIIAGIFAAAMSTLSSIINSISTLVSVDFYQKLVRNPNEKTAVRIAEWSGVGVGVVGIGIALLMSRFDIHSLFDVSIELAGLLGGGFAGAYTLGMFTRRANAPGVAIGVAGSILVTVACWTMDLVHPYFYLAISILLCIVIGYLASLLFPPPRQSLDGLTIYSKSDGKPAA